MDYLNLLPPNIHQDIVERVDVDKPFDLNIENGYYIPNYYHFIFSRLLELPEDINRVLTLSINGINYNKEEYKVHCDKFTLYNNILIGFDGFYPKIFFEGNRKVFLNTVRDDPTAFKILNISTENNLLLFNKLKELTLCGMCNSGFDIYL